MPIFNTSYGHFFVKKYDLFEQGPKQGADMEMLFWPTPLAEPGEFGFVQVVTAVKKHDNGTSELFDTAAPNRKCGEVVDEAWVDSSGNRCPIFGVEEPLMSEKWGGGFIPKENTKEIAGKIGFWKGVNKLPAWLEDRPTRDKVQNFEHSFETAVIVTRGVYKGTCMGVLLWGYKGGPGGHELFDIKVASQPSQRWKSVVQDGWNAKGTWIKVPLERLL